LKKEKPEVAEEELDIFSDLIWEGVFWPTVNTWNNISAQQIDFFQSKKRK